MTEDDLERLPRLSHPRRRFQYLAGRALLRIALERATGRPARSHRLCVSSEGKPECVEGPAISLSHSDDLIVCAVAETGSIGIDVQFARRRYAIGSIARACFSCTENKWLDDQPEERFFMLWVLKEAYLKAIGSGLPGGLDAVECRIAPPFIEASVTEGLATPNLAVYSMGSAFLGLAAIDCSLSGVLFEFVDAYGEESPPPDPQFIAMTDPGRSI